MPPCVISGEAEAFNTPVEEESQGLEESTFLVTPDDSSYQSSDDEERPRKFGNNSKRRHFRMNEMKIFGPYKFSEAICYCPRLEIFVTLLPRCESVAKLSVFGMAERNLNEAAFRDDIPKMVPSAEPLIYRLLCPRGTFRSDIWGRGTPNQGTGVWGNEFGRGLLVFVQNIEVKHSHRGRGIGTKVIRLAQKWTLKKAREVGQPAETCSYMVVRPCFLQEDIVRRFGDPIFDTGDFARDYGERRVEVQAFGDELAKRSIAFWRKQGFRRVGLSGFWAYATDPDHQSRRLTVLEDSRYDEINPHRLMV